MDQFQLFASPWWVNFFILFPFIAYYLWRGKIAISRDILIITAIFGMAFGYTEAASVVYLRGYAGLLSSQLFQSAAQSTQVFNAVVSQKLIQIDSLREFATIVMLVALAILAVRDKFSRWAVFFWVFAFWDIFYYMGLKVLIGWPQNIFTKDVLFLIPVPWDSQVWYPILVSLFLILAVLAGRKKTAKS